MLVFKKKKGKIKLNLFPNKANPSPPVGPTLGQKGLNIFNFCKEFNKKTKNLDNSWVVPTVIIYYSDKSYDFFIKKPTIFFYLKNILKLNLLLDCEKKIKFLSILEIVKFKISDFNCLNIYSNIKTIIGFLKSIKINFLNDY
ncbi:LSU ribosomal protein L11p (L12e) [Candidatus Nasuia deltocephalinicola]|uniref:Large ribosomal subunit protein uL11 n=1 Tax=Candidatus Nasuia deltocephalincola TaxID=1160784 RepID=A0A0S2UPN0_9PROT|nr:LSU ribosomal protein L11p (L12e) [Candidatus Nasuia deltocephalinicola]